MSSVAKKWTTVVTGVPETVQEEIPEEQPIDWIADYHPIWKSETHGRNAVILPKGINIVTISFLQRWMTVFGPTLATINDINVLESYFYKSFLHWLEITYITFGDFLDWEAYQENDGPYCNDSRFCYDEDFNFRTYQRLQLWVEVMAKGGKKPWMKSPCWIAAKHTTWKTMLSLMLPSSLILKKGFLKQLDNDSFEWTVNVENFVSSNYRRREKF
jgi:hypothetical protein